MKAVSPDATCVSRWLVALFPLAWSRTQSDVLPTSCLWGRPFSLHLGCCSLGSRGPWGDGGSRGSLCCPPCLEPRMPHSQGAEAMLRPTHPERPLGQAWPPQCHHELLPAEFSLKPGMGAGEFCLASQVSFLALVSFLLKQSYASKNVSKNKRKTSYICVIGAGLLYTALWSSGSSVTGLGTSLEK